MFAVKMKQVPDFGPDPFPGEPRLLFIGYAESTHTHAWIDLLRNARLNIRMFALPTEEPPANWPIRTYVTHANRHGPDSQDRIHLPENRKPGYLGRGLRKLGLVNLSPPPPREVAIEEWLGHILGSWQPQIVHTLGIDSASYFFRGIRRRFPAAGNPCWVVQVRGGPDLALNRLLPERAQLIREVLQECDQIIADNQLNYDICREMGVEEARIAPLGIIPGTGGVDVEDLSRTWSLPPSARRRIILWPKAYEWPQSKALPVIEALRLAWPRIQPCRLKCLTVVQPEIHMWVQTLPPDVRDAIELTPHVPRAEVFRLMSQARVMMAPSLSDGIPNCLYEAMACGSFPIVSPLETITPLVQSEKNVLFARNLYPVEIAEAMVRAMSDDTLVDTAARNNLELVRRVADRAQINPRVIAYYHDLIRAKQRGSREAKSTDRNSRTRPDPNENLIQDDGSQSFRKGEPCAS